MNEQEAIRKIQEHKDIHFRKEQRAVHVTEALNIAISALEEIQKYRNLGTVDGMQKLFANEIEHVNKLQKYEAIGTVEECRAAVEKQQAKKMSYEGDGCDDAGNIIYDTAICPVCGKNFEAEYCEHSAYCPECGTRIDWSVEE